MSEPTIEDMLHVNEYGDVGCPHSKLGEGVCDECRKILREIKDAIRTIIEKHFAVLDLVHSQAEDEALWFIADHMPEAYLQQELRKLHEAIEGKL